MYYRLTARLRTTRPSRGAILIVLLSAILGAASTFTLMTWGSGSPLRYMSATSIPDGTTPVTFWILGPIAKLGADVSAAGQIMQALLGVLVTVASCYLLFGVRNFYIAHRSSQTSSN